MALDRAIQTAIRARLVATPAVTDLVPALNIRDANALPSVDPCVIIGEAQAVDEGRIDRASVRVYSDLHVWKKESGLVGVKDIAAAIRDALHSSRLTATGYDVGDCFIQSVRYIRDPDGVTAHAIIEVESVCAPAN